MPARGPAGRSAGVRRRRHDPGPIVDPVVPPGPSPVDLHTHTLRSDGVLAPTELVSAAAACGVTTLAITDHDTLAGYREVAAAGGPARARAGPGRRDQRLRDPGPGPVGGRAPHPGVRHGPGRRRVRGGARRPARAAPDTVRSNRRTPPRAGPADRPGSGWRFRVDGDDALGRPTVARALSRQGTRRASRTPSAGCWGLAAPPTSRGSGSGRSRRSPRSAPPGASPSLAHFREAPERPEVIGELVEAGLGGLEVYYRSFDRMVVAGRRGRRGASSD